MIMLPRAAGDAEGAGAKARVRPEKVKTPYTRYVTRARSLISRIRCAPACLPAHLGWRFKSSRLPAGMLGVCCRVAPPPHDSSYMLRSKKHALVGASVRLAFCMPV